MGAVAAAAFAILLSTSQMAAAAGTQEATIVGGSGVTVGSQSSDQPPGCDAVSTRKECIGGEETGDVSIAGINCPWGYHCVFWHDHNSASHNYFYGDQNFTDDTFDVRNGNGLGLGEVVNDNVWSASNSSSANRESHFYYHINPTTSSRLVFCLNPGRSVRWDQLSNIGAPGDGQGQRDEMSALIIRPRTSVPCF
jgi:hypothetical protein